MEEKETTTALQDVFSGILSFFTSTKFFFKKEFKTELYWKHFSYSLALALIPMYLLTNYFHLGDTPALFQMFISGLCCYAVNWVREVIKEHKAQKEGWKYPFDYVDVYFGTYGGIMAGIIMMILNNLIG